MAYESSHNILPYLFPACLMSCCKVDEYGLLMMRVLADKSLVYEV